MLDYWTIGQVRSLCGKNGSLTQSFKTWNLRKSFCSTLTYQSRKGNSAKKNIYSFTNCNQITTNKEKTDFFFICQAGFDCLDFYRSIVLGHLRLDERNPCNVFVSKKSFEFHKLSRFICLFIFSCTVQVIVQQGSEKIFETIKKYYHNQHCYNKQPNSEDRHKDFTISGLTF